MERGERTSGKCTAAGTLRSRAAKHHATLSKSAQGEGRARCAECALGCVSPAFRSYQASAHSFAQLNAKGFTEPPETAICEKSLLALAYS